MKNMLAIKLVIVQAKTLDSNADTPIKNVKWTYLEKMESKAKKTYYDETKRTNLIRKKKKIK